MFAPLNHPYRFAWVAAPIVFVLPLLSARSIVDFQLHDTYFVSASVHLGLLLAMVLLLIGLVYWLARSLRLVSWMTATHLFLTVLFFLAIGVGIMLSSYFSLGDFRFFARINAVISVLVVAVVMSQFLFLLNLFIGLIRRLTD